MTDSKPALRLAIIGFCVVAVAAGCGFNGINSLALPGAVGRSPDADTYHVQIANVGTLESNSPVLIGDVVVGSVGAITVEGWHAEVEISLNHGARVPQNAVARVGQTSVLGSQHLALDPPLGEPPTGTLVPGTTIALNASSTYPSTEETLSSLSAVVNGGGLGQIGDVIHNFNAALSGRQDQVRQLLTRLDTFIGTLDAQRDNIVASLQGMNRLAADFAGERDVISRALNDIPPALDVLIKQRPRLTTALERLGTFSDTAAGVINDTQADLVHNLQNLEPAIRALADVGPQLDTALAAATIFPYSQNLIDRGVKGDYVNLFATFDLTVPRLKRTLFLGTRWGQPNAALTPAPGDPAAQNYTYAPLMTGLAPPQEAGVPYLPPSQGSPTPPAGGPVLPISPPIDALPSQSPQGVSPPIFAGPYPTTEPADANPPSAADPPNDDLPGGGH